MTSDEEKRRAAAQASRRYYHKNKERILTALREQRAIESAERRATRLAQRREYSAEWYQRRKENARAANKRWREKNKEYVREKNEVYNGWARATGRSAEHYLKRKYGMSLADYERLFLFQGGRCAICYQPERFQHPRGDAPVRLAVDHDHSNGMVRGLLCRRCNQAIGHFEENREWLLAAAEYVTAAQ